MRCSTNHPAILTLLDEMLGFFSEPAQVRGEISYTIACYEDAAQFPLPVPLHQKHTETIRLVTNTKLRYYVSDDYSVEYHSYAALPAMNAPALSVLQPADCTALTQLEAPEKYQPIFLRRCVLLIALGRLMHQFQYESCHAAAVSAPWDNQQGALIFGSSGSGKTTLSLGCALQGCGLLGDDLVMLREDASGVGVSAFALQAEVSMRAGTLDLLSALATLRNLPEDFRGKRHCSIEQVRAGAFRQQAPVRLLLFPTLVAAQENAVTRLSRARTLQDNPHRRDTTCTIRSEEVA